MPWDTTATREQAAAPASSFSSIQPLVFDPTSIANLPDECFSESSTKDGLTWKTLFCGSKTPTNTFTCGIAQAAPMVGELKLHRHTAPELYHILAGNGLIEINGVEYPARPGSVFFIPSNASHRVRNTSETEEFKWLYVFAVDDFGKVEYQWPSQQPNQMLGGMTQMGAEAWPAEAAAH